MPSPEAFSPLLIRAHLRSPVVADRYLPLDGLLLFQAYRALSGPQDVTLPGQSASQDVPVLPLRIAHPGRAQWYYQCSWAQWPEHVVEGVEHWNKRFDMGLADWVDFQGRRGKILTAEGEFKAYHAQIFYRSALWVEWYCVGDQAQLEHLLSSATHLGKKTVQGWGRVSRWEIVPIQADYSVWKGSRLMRGVPPDEAPGHITGLYGIRPSYWDRANQMRLALP
jgi:CRISPR type IV-associated protein Csf3